MKKINKNNQVSLTLVNQRSQPLGWEISLLGVIFKQGHFFIKGKQGREKKIEAGVYIPF